MATLKTKFSVGLFLIIGLAIAIVGIIWLGMSNYLEKGQYIVVYFDESVQGLDRDSPVKYRGVSIGRVHRIGVAPDENLIEVVLKIESDLQPQRPTVDIVAQLKSVGITGLMFVELERSRPEENLFYPPLTFEPPYPVFPTRPSEISRIFQGIQDVFDTIRVLDTQSISQQLIQVLQSINHTLDEAQLAALVDDARSTVQTIQKLIQGEKIHRMMASIEQGADSFNKMSTNADDGISEIRQTVSHLDGVLAHSGEDIAQITSDLKVSAQQVKRTMETATALLENTDHQMDALQRQVVVTLNRIERASDTLNRFLDRVAAEPSQLIFSGPPAEKPVAP